MSGSARALGITAAAGIAAFALATIGARGAERQSAETASLDLARAELVDLTHPLDEQTIFWPTAPSRFVLETLHRGTTADGYYYEANRFCMPEHGGTHIDAPVHFAKAGWALGAVPLDRLVAPAVVIDVREQAAADRDYRLEVRDIERFEAVHGRIARGAIVLLRTGWSSRWPNAKAYLGDDTPGDASNLHFPSYGEEAARFLIDKRGVHGLGVDTASIDYGPSRDFPVHRVAGAANVFGLENLTALERVPPTGAWVAALPIKIANGSGGPVRVVALVPAT